MAVNLSVIHTAKCRDLDIVSFLKTILLSGYHAASEVLFGNSS